MDDPLKTICSKEIVNSPVVGELGVMASMVGPKGPLLPPDWSAIVGIATTDPLDTWVVARVAVVSYVTPVSWVCVVPLSPVQ